MKPRILTVSSANMDFVMNVTRIPQAGETSIEEHYDYIPGGKGSNSAVAFSRLGADSVFCCRLGDDINGAKLKNFYNDQGIDTRFIGLDKNEHTGLAVIMVEQNGMNRIVVYPGANSALMTEQIEEAFMCYPDAVFIQFEIPFAAAVAATTFAEKQGIPVFVDAGPASSALSLRKLKNVEIFSPNETETYTYTGIMPTDVEKCLKACMALEQMVDAKYYVLKLGGRGAFLYDRRYYKLFSSFDIDVVDTTAAGDAFTAALSLEYLRSKDIRRACVYANLVGSLTVSKKGASPSIPTTEEIRRFIDLNGIDFKL